MHTRALARQEETMGAIPAKGSSTDGSAFDRACEKCFYGWRWREATVQRGTRKAGGPTPGTSRDAKRSRRSERAESNARPAARGAAQAADHLSADRGRRVLLLRRPGRSDGIRNAQCALPLRARKADNREVLRTRRGRAVHHERRQSPHGRPLDVPLPDHGWLLGRALRSHRQPTRTRRHLGRERRLVRIPT